MLQSVLVGDPRSEKYHVGAERTMHAEYKMCSTVQ